MKFATIALTLLLAGCSAEFTDLRPASERDAFTPAAADDVGPSSDAGNNAGDDGDDSDGGDQTNAETGAETLVATGDFINVDYDTTGSAQYWRLADGTYEVRLTGDFSTGGVPGPALALSPRNPLGGSIGGDELDIGALDADTGAQSYPLPGPPDGYAFVWIWCKPFGLDVAFAEMEFQ